MVMPHYHHNPPPAPTTQTGTRTLTPEKLAKLRSQLDVVQGNIQVMSEMLIAVTPGYVNPEDDELLKVSFYNISIISLNILISDVFLFKSECDYLKICKKIDAG